MKHSHLGSALQKLRSALGKTPDDTAALTGASFLELEPDLQKEAGEHTRQTSGWAAGGQPFSE